MDLVMRRTLNILSAVCETYIETGVPVTSTVLYDRYDFGIKPAMIRWALNDLCQQGYLLQEHASAGRVPTDEAYRYYADTLLSEVEQEEQDSHSGISEEYRRLRLLFQESSHEELARELSLHLRLLSIVYAEEEDRFFERGLDALCERLLSESSGSLPLVMRDYECMRDKLLGEASSVHDEVEDSLRVYVGESPFTTSREVSVIMNRIVRDGRPYTLLAIGPKRMDYRRSLSIFHFL